MCYILVFIHTFTHAKHTLVVSQEDLRGLVDQRIPTLLKNSNVRLIVIDSIAAIFRVEYTMNENIERSRALADLGQKLHKISHEYNTGIVCINQV